jgi:hypothetical protein
MTGTLTSSSPNVGSLVASGAPPFATTSYLPFVGQPVSGTGIPVGTTVLIVTNPTTVVLSQNATAGGSQVLTFGVEPVTLAEAMLHCRFEIPSTDPIYASETALISSLITAARKYCETRLRSSLITQTWILCLDGFPAGNASYYNKSVRPIWAAQGAIAGANAFGAGVIPSAAGVIDIPLPPLQKVFSINYLDFSNNLVTLSPSVYNVSTGVPGRIQPVYSQFWPINPPIIDSVQVTFQCGFGALESNVPATIQTAMKYMISTWYEERTTVGIGQYMRVPDTAESLLSVDEPGIYA